MMTKPDVLLQIRWDADNKVSAFADRLAGREVLNYEGEAGVDLSAVRYAVVWKPDPGLLASLPSLEVIFSLGAGVDHLLSDPQLPTDKPIVRFVDPDLTGRMVEWIALQVLLHLRQQRVYDAQQRKRLWQENMQPAAKDLRVGIMGFGELGQACAKALLALGFPVNGWARSPKQFEAVTTYAGDGELDAFLNHTDVLVSLLPYTQDTHGILNSALFEKLSRDNPFGAPFLINAGRGGSQVESDIVAALKDGTLAGVSLDVFETEPLDPYSPLWGFDNAIITPHIAALSEPNALANYVGDQIERYEAGRSLENLVDMKRGY
ncbi:2-hydroxyacid dehydrogenase [Pseudahrensia aquimaris]|uniref:2-hydroxyacid dehydrogenase n=1 Tax=Pseudahrensia aquimaris TaxID=744461 RepID=A0ABW3FH19_9HYPH